MRMLDLGDKIRFPQMFEIELVEGAKLIAAVAAANNISAAAAAAAAAHENNPKFVTFMKIIFKN